MKSEIKKTEIDRNFTFSNKKHSAMYQFFCEIVFTAKHVVNSFRSFGERRKKELKNALFLCEQMDFFFVLVCVYFTSICVFIYCINAAKRIHFAWAKENIVSLVDWLYDMKIPMYRISIFNELKIKNTQISVAHRFVQIEYYLIFGNWLPNENVQKAMEKLKKNTPKIETGKLKRWNPSIYIENYATTEYIVSTSIIQYATLMNNFNRKQTSVKGTRVPINVELDTGMKTIN